MIEHTQQEDKLNRNTVLDFAKGLAILLMIYDHLAQHGKLITSFNMPMFFILSGLVLKDIDLKIMAKKKLKRLILPYFEYGIVAILCCMIFQPENRSFSYAISRFGSLWILRDTWLLYFLPALFMASLLYMAIKYACKDKWYLKWAILLVLNFCGYLLAEKYGQDNFYNIDLVFIATTFIGVGEEAKRVNWSKFNLPIRILLMVAALIIWFFAWKYGGLVMALRIYWCYPLNIIGAITATYVVMRVCHYLDRIPLLNTSFRYLGRNTLFIFCVANVLRQIWVYTPSVAEGEVAILTAPDTWIQFLLQMAIVAVALILRELYLKLKGRVSC